MRRPGVQLALLHLGRKLITRMGATLTASAALQFYRACTLAMHTVVRPSLQTSKTGVVSAGTSSQETPGQPPAPPPVVTRAEKLMEERLRSLLGPSTAPKRGGPHHAGAGEGGASRDLDLLRQGPCTT